jgi:hypothetical protein
MSDTLSAALRSTAAWDRVEDTALGTRRDKTTSQHVATIVDGAGVGQADRVFHDQRMVAAGGTDTLDLAALTQQMFGTAVPMSFSVVRALIVTNLEQTPGRYLHVGADAASPATRYALRVGSASRCMVSSVQEGWSTSGANILRMFNPGAAAVSYQIIVIGA